MDSKIKEIWDNIAKTFDKVRSPFAKLFAQWQKVVIITHGDMDGIMSAILIYQILRKHCEQIEIVFTQPYFIHHYLNSCEVYDLIVVLDLSINNRNINSSSQFLDKYQNKLVWIDHHVSEMIHPSLICESSHTSCVYFLKNLLKNTNIKFSKKINELCEIANACDMGETNNIYNKALKINLKSNESRKEIWDYAISIPNGALEKVSIEKINEKAKRYEEVFSNTDALFNNKERTKIYDLVTIIDNIDNTLHTIDKTLLAFMVYEETPYMIYKFKSKPRKVKQANGKYKSVSNEYVTVTCDTSQTRTDLRKIFKFKSGAKYRITRPNFGDSYMSDEDYIQFLSEKHKPR